MSKMRGSRSSPHLIFITAAMNYSALSMIELNILHWTPSRYGSSTLFLNHKANLRCQYLRGPGMNDLRLCLLNNGDTLWQTEAVIMNPSCLTVLLVTIVAA